MNITAKLAHETLKLIADINQTQPADGQETAPASSLDAMPVETLAALNHAGWMKLLMEQDDWRETDDKLQELPTNLRCRAVTAGVDYQLVASARAGYGHNSAMD